MSFSFPLDDDPCAMRWVRLAPKGTPPCPRCSHTATLDSVAGTLFVIGGGVAQAHSREFIHFGDVHSLDLRTLRWTLRLDEDAANFPPRRGHTAIHHKASNTIVIFGGTSESAERGVAELNKVHVLCIGDEAIRWEQPETRGVSPRGRRGHRAVIVADATMFILGGYPHKIRHIRDLELGLWALHVGTWAWSEVHAAGSPPRGLAMFGCVLVGSSTLVCFGGHEFGLVTDESQMSSRVHLADLSAVTSLNQADEAASKVPMDPNAEVPVVSWHAVTPISPADVLPSPRFCHELATISETDAAGCDGVSLIVFGGSEEGGAPLGDLHALRLSADASPSSPPNEASRSALLTADEAFQASVALLSGDTGDTALISGDAGDAAAGGPGDAAAPPAPGYGSGPLTTAIPSYSFVAARLDQPGPTNLPEHLEARPAPRNAMTLTRLSADRLLLFGGGVFPTAYFGELWALERDTAAPCLPPPSPRASAPLVPHLESLVGSARLSDVLIELEDGEAPVPAHRVLLCSGASRYFSAALEGSFREGVAAAAGGQVTLRLPAPIPRPTLLAMLRWMYTGASPLPDPGERSNDDGGAPPAASEPQPADEVISLLVAADVLEMDGLRELCEGCLASSIDKEQAVQMLLLAESLHCSRLRALCVEWLGWYAGTWARQRRRSANERSLDWPGVDAMGDGQVGGDAAAALASALLGDELGVLGAQPEVEAMLAELRSMSGFEQLSATSRRELETCLGFEVGELALQDDAGDAASVEDKSETTQTGSIVSGSTGC